MSWRLFLVLPTAFLFLGCVNPSSTSNPKVARVDHINSAPTIASIHYFKGGYYSAPEMPNWTHDMTITVSGSGAGAMAGKDYDALCFRAGYLASQDLNELLAGIQALQITRLREGAIIADAGVEYIELIYSNGQIRKIHLLALEYEIGEEVASNGLALAERLRSIGSNLSIGCR